MASCAKLQEIDVSELEGSAHAVKAGHKLRKDVPEPSLAQDAVLAGGPPGIQDGFFRVPPRIVEGGE